MSEQDLQDLLVESQQPLVIPVAELVGMLVFGAFCVLLLAWATKKE